MKLADRARPKLFRFASLLWGCSNALIRSAYARGWMEAAELPCPVISLGNIEAGGTGKTPLVADLARFLGKQGVTVAILTRGYKSQVEQDRGVRVLRPGQKAQVDDVGDEATLLRLLAPQAWIGVGPQRLRAFREVARESDSEIGAVILDDGFQQFGIRRSCDVLALTSHVSGEALFRERNDAVRFFDGVLLWTKGETKPPEWDSVPADRRSRVEWHTQVLSGALGKTYWLISGVGNPKAAAKALKKAGFAIERHTVLPDHVWMSPESVRGQFEEAQKKGLQILLTGKDWVKWQARAAELLPSGWSDWVTVVESVPDAKLAEVWSRVWDQVQVK